MPSMFKCSAVLAAALLSGTIPVAAVAQTLEAYAVLPADTFEPGPTSGGGSGTISVQSFITLRDPDFKINFPIVAEKPTYYSTTNIPVDIAIVRNRYLTGADFDIESVRDAHDGTLWFGERRSRFLVYSRRRILFLRVARRICRPAADSRGWQSRRMARRLSTARRIAHH
jgi:hypothetical protein